MNTEEIIRKLVERVILPKYPFLKLYQIDSYNLTQLKEYDVRLITKKRLDEKMQMEIDTEIKNLFTMAGLDSIERFQRNKVVTWFKAPNGKSWTFKSGPDYKHI